MVLSFVSFLFFNFQALADCNHCLPVAIGTAIICQSWSQVNPYSGVNILCMCRLHVRCWPTYTYCPTDYRRPDILPHYLVVFFAFNPNFTLSQFTSSVISNYYLPSLLLNVTFPLRCSPFLSAPISIIPQANAIVVDRFFSPFSSYFHIRVTHDHRSANSLLS